MGLNVEHRYEHTILLLHQAPCDGISHEPSGRLWGTPSKAKRECEHELALAHAGLAYPFEHTRYHVFCLAHLKVPPQRIHYHVCQHTPFRSSNPLLEAYLQCEHITLYARPHEKNIPFEVEYLASNDVEIDQEEIITQGVLGLIVSRTRVRYEDGIEVSREVEGEKTLRQPSTQVVAYGTKYVIHTVTVDGKTIQYWRAIPVYATSYSPCAAGEPCYPNTSSGKRVQRGVIAVIRSWYYEMKGQAVYIPGYGYATIEDVGGGIPGKDWIDLGYSDADYQPWHQWVTMYFLP